MLRQLTGLPHPTAYCMLDVTRFIYVPVVRQTEQYFIYQVSLGLLSLWVWQSCSRTTQQIALHWYILLLYISRIKRDCCYTRIKMLHITWIASLLTRFSNLQSRLKKWKRLLAQWKAKQSCGHDSISPTLLKEIKHEISLPLSTLINKSLQEGCVPQNLKIAKVLPIYKSKEDNLLQFSAITKVLERIVYNRVMTFLIRITNYINTNMAFVKDILLYMQFLNS